MNLNSLNNLHTIQHLAMGVPPSVNLTNEDTLDLGDFILSYPTEGEPRYKVKRFATKERRAFSVYFPTLAAALDWVCYWDGDNKAH